MSTNRKQQNSATGRKGEDIAAKYLERKGFVVMARNYWKKWGEIDLICQKSHKIHFIEVKSVSYETKTDLEKAVSYGTWRPEENVHRFKLQKLARAIESWLLENNWSGDWQTDVVAVRFVPRETYATVKYIENIII